jgi:hypothetical protein
MAAGLDVVNLVSGNNSADDCGHPVIVRRNQIAPLCDRIGQWGIGSPGSGPVVGPRSVSTAAVIGLSDDHFATVRTAVCWARALGALVVLVSIH